MGITAHNWFILRRAAHRAGYRSAAHRALGVAALTISSAAVAQPAHTSIEAASAATAPAKPPFSIQANLSFMHYADVKAAASWYEKVLGLHKLSDHGWLVMFRLAPGAQLGLVDASNKAARKRDAIPNRPLLTIETDQLEAWYDALKDRPDVTVVNGIGIDGNGLIDEFRIRDPEGYMLEFFRWRTNDKPPR